MQQSNDAPPFQVQEIDQPGNDWKIHETSPPATYQADRQELELAEKPNSGLPEELRSSTISPKVSRLQSRRMENFSYEPLSVPTSRVPSDASSNQTQRLSMDQGLPSPRLSPRLEHSSSQASASEATASKDREGAGAPGPTSQATQLDITKITPEITPPTKPEVNNIETTYIGSTYNYSPHIFRPQEPNNIQSVSRSVNSTAAAEEGTRTSQPSLSDEARSSVTGSPTVSGPPAHRNSAIGQAAYKWSSPRSQPFAPTGEHDNPYARSRRPLQLEKGEFIDPRFIFGSKEHRRPTTTMSAQRSHSSGPHSDESSRDVERRRSTIFGSKNIDAQKDQPANSGKAQNSMSDLKRFFKFGPSKHKDKKSRPSSASRRSFKLGSQTPTHHAAQPVVPFADDHGLEKKYGKFGKVLGSGAGGSVRLLKRSSDGVTFAVKQFRARHAYESERDYNKKVTAEFCVGSTLHHGNIIETMDIIHERGSWYEVMEFAPFDLFATVMTGKMTRDEITCSFAQIISGVNYLHNMGLAHRDLKLDNVVMNDKGIMKIIDFGSAFVFRYPFENDMVFANGIVGSDPYLAPEVYDGAKYNPQMVDIWSLAIIFCCMSLRRFPWKQPRITDASYKLFVSPSELPVLASSSTQGVRADQKATPMKKVEGPTSLAGGFATDGPSVEGQPHHHHHHHHNDGQTHTGDGAIQSAAAPAAKEAVGHISQPSNETQQQQQVIKGPWRLLRLLPRESRYIIGQMLEVDISKRATMDQILADRWILSSEFCYQEDGGQVINAARHQHTLEPGGTTLTPAPSRK